MFIKTNLAPTDVSGRILWHKEVPESLKRHTHMAYVSNLPRKVYKSPLPTPSIFHILTSGLFIPKPRQWQVMWTETWNSLDSLIWCSLFSPPRLQLGASKNARTQPHGLFCVPQLSTVSIKLRQTTKWSICWPSQLSLMISVFFPWSKAKTKRWWFLSLENPPFLPKASYPFIRRHSENPENDIEAPGSPDLSPYSHTVYNVSSVRPSFLSYHQAWPNRLKKSKTCEAMATVIQKPTNIYS